MPVPIIHIKGPFFYDDKEGPLFIAVSGLHLLNFYGADLVVPPVFRKAPASERIVGLSGENLAFALEIDVLIDGDFADTLPDHHARDLIVPVWAALRARVPLPQI